MAPGLPGWEESAGRWLRQFLPPGFLDHEVVQGSPMVVAYIVRKQLEAQLRGARRGFSRARVELGEVMEPHQLEAAMGAMSQEGSRLALTSRSVALVAEGLIHGVRWRRSARRDPGGRAGAGAGWADAPGRTAARLPEIPDGQPGVAGSVTA